MVKVNWDWSDTGKWNLQTRSREKRSSLQNIADGDLLDEDTEDLELTPLKPGGTVAAINKEMDIGGGYTGDDSGSKAAKTVRSFDSAPQNRI